MRTQDSDSRTPGIGGRHGASLERRRPETVTGSFGILPHRLDCAAALVPGIFVYETEDEGEIYVAVDEGVLVKSGFDVAVSVRNAFGGSDLAELQRCVQREFVNLDAEEKTARSVMGKMESGFIRQLADFNRK